MSKRKVSDSVTDKLDRVDDTSKKRTKSKDFKDEEITVIIEEYTANKETLKSKFKTNITNKKKAEIWCSITDKVNEKSPTGVTRTVEQVKHKWRDLTQHARQDNDEMKRPPTGGGKQKSRGTYSDLVLDVIGKQSAAISGIGGGLESGGKACSGARAESNCGDDSDIDTCEDIVSVSSIDKNLETNREAEVSDTQQISLAIPQESGLEGSNISTIVEKPAKTNHTLVRESAKAHPVKPNSSSSVAVRESADAHPVKPNSSSSVSHRDDAERDIDTRSDSRLKAEKGRKSVACNDIEKLKVDLLKEELLKVKEERQLIREKRELVELKKNLIRRKLEPPTHTHTPTYRETFVRDPDPSFFDPAVPQYLNL